MQEKSTNITNENELTQEPLDVEQLEDATGGISTRKPVALYVEKLPTNRPSSNAILNSDPGAGKL